MKRKPYDKVVVKGNTYYDYNFKIKGIIYEVSINVNNGDLYITKDEDQNEE